MYYMRLVIYMYTVLCVFVCIIKRIVVSEHSFIRLLRRNIMKSGNHTGCREEQLWIFCFVPSCYKEHQASSYSWPVVEQLKQQILASSIIQRAIGCYWSIIINKSSWPQTWYICSFIAHHIALSWGMLFPFISTVLSFPVDVFSFNL